MTPAPVHPPVDDVRGPSVTLDPADAETVVRRALADGGHADVRLQAVKVRENHVYRARTDGVDLAVRLHRPGLRSTAEIRTELGYVRALGDRGFPVPRPWGAPDGEAVLLVAHRGTTVQVDALHWVTGSAPLGDSGEAFAGRSPLTPADLHRVGALAGRLHNHTADLGRLPDYRRDRWDADGLVGPGALWGDPAALPALTADQRALLLRAVARLHGDLASASTGPEVFGVVHADFTPENILVRAGELVVIDFDDLGEGWHLFELATALFFFLPDPRFEALRAAAVAGYRSERTLPEEDLQLWPAMLLARGLTYLAWAAARPAEPTSQFLAAEVLPVVVGLAERYLAGDPA